jgi:hypothetical protein
MPGAEMPSSLVTNISGLFFISEMGNLIKSAQN